MVARRAWVESDDEDRGSVRVRDSGRIRAASVRRLPTGEYRRSRQVCLENGIVVVLDLGDLFVHVRQSPSLH